MAGDGDGKALDPWRIGILVLIIGSVALAFWFMTSIMDARFNAIEGQIRSSTDSLSQQIGTNRNLIVQSVNVSSAAAAAAPAPPAAAAATEGEAAEGEAAEGEAAPAAAEGAAAEGGGE